MRRLVLVFAFLTFSLFLLTACKITPEESQNSNNEESSESVSAIESESESESVSEEECQHSYDNACDTDCNECGDIRTVGEHETDASGYCVLCDQPFGSTEGILYEVSDDGTYAVALGYSGTAKRVIIADSFGGVPVTTIYTEAFKNSDITSVVIPDSVTSIGGWAFYDCDSLTSVEFPDLVTSIGNSAFQYCSKLTSVVIPDSVTSIGDKVFYGCSNLTSVVIPHSVTRIDGNAFGGCNSALYTEYEYGTYLGDGKNPYAALISLTNKNLKTYTMHEDTRIIAYGVFQNCERISKITIPNSVTSIGKCAFYNCKNLTSVEFPDSVIYIGGSAFEGCTSLTSAYYHGTGAKWGKIAIDSYNYNLTNATRCYYYSKSEPTDPGDYWHYDDDGNAVVWEKKYNTGLVFTVSDDAETYFIADYTGSDAEVIIPATYNGSPVASIGYGAFSGCINLTSVVIPDTITSIGTNAFYNCRNLTNIVIPDSVTSIGDKAFYDCRSLTSVEIPDSVESIRFGTFSGCDSLMSVVIGDSVTSINVEVFKGCSSLTSVDIGDSVTNIGISAFSGCNSALYTEYEYGTYVGNGENPYAILISLTNKNLNTYTIHENTRIIASAAFSGCTSLTSIVIPDSVTSISEWAFSSCYNLASVVIGDSVTSIGEWAFSSCYNLTSVVIPDSVTSIGSSAFYNCDSLTSVYYGGTEEEWNEIEIGSYNDDLTAATRYYCSEGEPDCVLPPAGSEIGDLCPTRLLPLLDGSGESLDPSKPTTPVTILNFWYTTCTPCFAELPDFNRIANDYKGVAKVIAVHSAMKSGTKTPPEYVPEFIQNNFADYENVVFAYDPDDSFYYDDLAGLGGWPMTVILDENGVIILKKAGKIDYETLKGIIESELAK